MAMIYNSNYPSFHIMICMLQIWELEGDDLMTVPDNAMIITEVGELEVVESYKELIGTASIRFPRGTVVRKTVTRDNEKEVANAEELKTSLDYSGVIQEIWNTSEAVNTRSFHPGMRIRIRLGYTQDPKIANLGKVRSMSKNIFNDVDARITYMKACNYYAFDGYITKVSVDTPIQLECENLASGLKNVTFPVGLQVREKNTINFLLGDKDGEQNLLKGTGLRLYDSKSLDQYDLGKISSDVTLSVADVLAGWSKIGLHAFLVYNNDGNPCIAVGRTYFHDTKGDSIVNIINGSSSVPTIRFDYHVAKNGLTLTSAEKRFVAVKAEGLNSEDKFIRLTCMYDPAYVPDSEEEGASKNKYRMVNESAYSKKEMQAMGYDTSTMTDEEKKAYNEKKANNKKVDMKMYTVIPYHSTKTPITREELFEEAKKYLESYTPNGIEGTLTLFGDLGIHTGTQVKLQDDRYPGKNGYYLVEEVTTTYGTGGYRQQIKIPYRISKSEEVREQEMKEGEAKMDANTDNTNK